MRIKKTETECLSGIGEILLRTKTQKNLADLVGITASAVQKWADNGFAPKARVPLLSQMFGVDEARLCNPKLLNKNKKNIK